MRSACQELPAHAPHLPGLFAFSAAPPHGAAALTPEPMMDMELSQNFLRAKSPCAAGFRWFVRNRHDGNDYQRVLDALVGDGRVEDAR